MIIAQEAASVRDLNLSMCFPVLLSRSLERLVRGKTREIRKPELAFSSVAEGSSDLVKMQDWKEWNLMGS